MDFDFGNVPSRAHELFRRLESEGAEFFKTLVAAQKSEELFLDYKQITTSPEDRTLGNTDRKNLRKALSGFANSEGGVILWGCGTKKIDGVEVIEMPDGHPDVARFVSLLEDAVSGCTVPPVPGVRSIQIPLNEESTKGLAATLVPASLIAPHQTTDDARAYHMRAGSSFPHVPHGVLAGMFGRRPSPKISLGMTVGDCWMELEHGIETMFLTIDLEISNLSSVIARDCYITWSAKELGSPMSRGKPRLLVPGTPWGVNQVDGGNGSILAEETNRVAPYSRCRVLSIDWRFQEPFKEGLDISFYFGCDGSPPNHYQIFVSQEDLVASMEKLKGRRGRTYSGSFPNLRIAQHMLGLE